MANGFDFTKAIGNVGGLLSGEGDMAPLFNIGTGLLAASGPTQQPTSFGQRLGVALNSAGQAQQAGLRNQFIRERIRAASEERAAQQQRQESMERLREGLLGAGEVEPGTGNVSGLSQNEAMGLLADIAPQQVAQGLLSQMMPQQRAEPSIVRTARAIGLDPTSDEGRKFIIDSVGPNTSTEQLDQLLKGLQIQKLQTERTEKAQSVADKNREASRSAIKGIDQVKEMARLNTELEGTALETGAGLDDLRRAAAGGVSFLKSQFGFGDREAKALVAKFDRFNKLATQQVVGSVESLQGTGAITNNKFQALLSLKPGTGTSPGANRLILADMLESFIEAAEDQGVKVPQRERELLRTLRESEQAAPAAPQAGAQQQRVIDFNDLP